MTKVLWITNILFPEAEGLLTGNPAQMQGSGGWLVSSAERIMKKGDMQLVAVSPSNLVKTMTKVTGEYITYYILPCRNERKYEPIFEDLWREISEAERPDLVHIHGTEFSHGLAYLHAGINIPTVLSIQGLSEEIGYHYLDGMNWKDVYGNMTLFDLIYGGSMFKQRQRYIDHGKRVEREMIRSVKHIIGRTTFDRSHVTMLNPSAIYHKCNESLREEFYEGKVWNYDNCQKHTIFLSQSTYPVKGLHQVLKAMPYVLAQFPDTQIKLAGGDIMAAETIKKKLTKSSYSKYIRRLINRVGMRGKVQFLGPLNAAQMAEEFLSCNVFVSPSSIENSPNSVGEAQMLGVPCIASFVGGTPDMIPSPSCGCLYRNDDVVSLAYQICELFNNSSRFDSFEMIETARLRHDVSANTEQLLTIYKEVISLEDK